MKEWFTVELLDNDTYVISEYNHWEETHCYLLLGTNKAVLIDTGLGISNIKDVIDELTKLPIFVITTHAPNSNLTTLLQLKQSVQPLYNA